MPRRMHILVGDTYSPTIVEKLRALRWGRMFSEKAPKPYPGERYGLDNRAFIYWRKGRPFDDDAFKRTLEGVVDQIAKKKARLPYLSVAPDIVAGGRRSLDFSFDWFMRMPDDWPVYLAVQDGMTRRDVEGVIRAGWAGLFLGGTNRFKKTAPIWSDLAHEFGLKFHYARAGTLRKVEVAKHAHADSLDSAFPLWTASRLEQFITEVTEGTASGYLPGVVPPEELSCARIRHRRTP